MNIEKLKSGSYRISETRNGIRHRITIPYKPTKKRHTSSCRIKSTTYTTP